MRMIRAIRWLAVAAGALAIGLTLLIGYCEYRNSMTVISPPATELREHFARAQHWVDANSTRLLNENNPALWLFVRDAARAAGDTRLLDLASEYQKRHVQGTPAQYLFDPSGSEQLAGQQLSFGDSVNDYNRLFFYGSTCNASLREDPLVQTLLDPKKACGQPLGWLRSPWCRTHQLMGLRFVQKNHCEPGAETAATITSVQNDILFELSWDFRVEDAYLQKVLTLVESGRRQDVKAIWIRRILEAQRPDGGWDGVDVVARLPQDRLLVWTDGRLYPSIRPQPASTFHATAQGLYLLALLLQEPGQSAH